MIKEDKKQITKIKLREYRKNEVRKVLDHIAMIIADMTDVNQRCYILARQKGRKEEVIQNGSAYMILSALNHRLESYIPDYKMISEKQFKQKKKK